jgi:hypothetical protein
LNFGAEEPRQAKSAAKEDSSAVAGPVAPAGGLPALPTLPTVPNAEAMASSLAQIHPEAVEMVQEAWMKMVKHVIANTEDVGQNFAEEARKMHYGESEERNIRGQASAEETQDLLEEGIEVLPLPVPDSLKGGLQ